MAIALVSVMCGREEWARLISNLQLCTSFWYSSNWNGLGKNRRDLDDPSSITFMLPCHSRICYFASRNIFRYQLVIYESLAHFTLFDCWSNHSVGCYQREGRWRTEVVAVLCSDWPLVVQRLPAGCFHCLIAWTTQRKGWHPSTKVCNNNNNNSA